MSTIVETIPMIIRGEVVDTDLQDFGRFRAPSVVEHLDRLVLRDPASLRELQALPLQEIIDYLVALGGALDIEHNQHLQQALAMTEGGALYSGEMLREIYRGIPRLLTHEYLDEYIEQNIGRAYLEGWVETDLHDRSVAVRAFGARAVHVIAGNSPLISVQTVMSNAIARSDAIVKIPANDPYAIIAIAKTMIEMAPDHPVTRHLSAAYWKGGDDEVERRLYDSRNIEKIVAWGGFNSMRSIRTYLAPGLDLVALDPKLSASIVGREAFASAGALADAVARAAADVGYVNQGGCANARVLYLESGTDPDGIARANAFGELLFAAIQELPPALSSPHPAFDPVLREELDGIRYGEDFRVIGGRADEGAVIVSQSEEAVDFADRLDCRVANLVPVDTADDALRYLTIHTQTIGIYPDELKVRLRDECAVRGGQRLVSLGSATAADMIGPWDAIQLLSRMVRWLRDDTLKVAVAQG